MMKPSKAQAQDRIQRALDAIPALVSMPYSSQEFTKWHRSTGVAIGRTFGENSEHIETFKKIRYSPIVFDIDAPDHQFQADCQKAYLDGLQSTTPILESMIEEIEEYWQDDVETQSETGQRDAGEPIGTNRVFVVHGRDEAAKQTVARYLEGLGLEPIILQEQPNEGRTIIEKFEKYAQVGFAVVLCTPDDVGALESEQGELKPRPRQNVVLEWGFFLGKIGRGRVCALFKGDVEIPSDYDGVIYVQMDEYGAWKTELAKEMKAAGLTVDMNRL